MLSTPALNIDLSYFESNEQPVTKSVASTTQNKSKPTPNNNTTTNSNKTEPNSRVYLDKLLEEIFTNNPKKPTDHIQQKIQAKTVATSAANSLGGGGGKEDDLFSDKKCDLTFFN